MLDPRRAAKLSPAHVVRAVALFQSADDQTSVYVLGADGKQRLLDTVELRAPTDASGNTQWVLDGRSLAPDGKRAAFAQRDEVVVVDLTTGRAERLPLRGFNENVPWQPGAQGLIVEQADKTYLLDLRTGATRQPYAGFDSVASVGVGIGNIVRLGSSDRDGSALSQWTPSGVSISTTRLPVSWVAARDWYGTGWRNGGLVARSVFAPIDLEPSGAGEATVVIDVASGKVVRALLFPRAPEPGGSCSAARCEAGWGRTPSLCRTRIGF